MAKLTSEHYQAVAAIIRAEWTFVHTWDDEKRMLAALGVLVRIADRFSDAMSKDNPRFDPEIFYSACGMERK